MCSVESRAAARMLLEHQRHSVERVMIRSDIGGLDCYPKVHDPAKLRKKY
jgi:hypothetical protein